MDIIKKRRKEKEDMINRITEGLRKVIKKCNGNFPINFKTIVMTIQSSIYCSKRTAEDYANLALFKVGMTRTDLPYENHGYNIKLEIPNSKKEVNN